MHHLTLEQSVVLLQRGDGGVCADVAIGGPLVSPTCSAHRGRRITVVHLKGINPEAILYLVFE